MSCPSPCCLWCMEKCCIKPDRKYPHIRYKSPEQAGRAVKMPEVRQVPVKTIFQFQRQQMEFPVHPQVDDVITSQPRSFQRPLQNFMIPSGIPRSRSFESIPRSLGQRRQSKSFSGVLTLETAQTNLQWQTLTQQSFGIPQRKYSSRIRKASLQRRTALDGEPVRKSQSFPRAHQQPLSEISESFETEGPSDSFDYSEADAGEPLLTIPQSILPHPGNESCATLHFSLYYDLQRHTLTLDLKEARNLPAKDSRGTRDPLVVVYLDPNKDEIFESKVVLKTLHPRFDQVFTFKKLLPDEVRRQTLVFRIYNHDRRRHSKDDFIGAVMLPLSEADLYGVTLTMRIDEDAKELKRTTRGYILLSLTYIPNRGKIQGIVYKATNLQKYDLVGGADPYVKIYLIHKGKRHTKWKTSVKKNTLLPVFNEAFKFDISNMEIKDVSLEVCVMDYDRFSRNDVVGVVHIGESVEHETGREHWTEMISSTHHAISLWHPILPLASK